LNISMSDVIAVIALLVASLAALYARWSARAADRGNQIALHDSRVEIYLELRKFENCFRGFCSYPTDDDLNTFYEKGVVMSELFFPPKISSALNELYDDCWNQSRRISAYEDEEGDPSLQGEFEREFNNLGKEAIPHLSKLLRAEVEIFHA